MSGSKEKESANKDRDKDRDKDKDAKGNRFHSPPVELPNSNAQNFFEEAKITHVEESELKRKFGKFCRKAGRASPEDEAYLALDDFCRMLQYYECASAHHYEAYFHAIDRNHDDKCLFVHNFAHSGWCGANIDIAEWFGDASNGSWCWRVWI